MRVLLTADPDLPVPPLLYGGIERIIASLVSGLLAEGHEVGLLAHRDSECDATAKFAWPTGINPLSHLETLRQTVRTFAPQIVHSFSRLLYLLPILPGRRLPKIMSFQREPTPRTVKWAARIAGPSLRFTGCSDYISQRGRAAGGNWNTVHNFVDVQRYKFQRDTQPDAPLVFLSRIERIKGAHTAIAACRRAGRRLIIAGNHAEDDSEHGRYWREEILPHLGRDGIEYVGPVNDAQKNELLGRAAAMIVPIEWEEPFGIVFAEALACGTPVISCPRGALPEIVRDGIDGFLVGSQDEMVKSIEQLASLDRSACRRRAEEKFSMQACVSGYEGLYRRSIKEN